MPGLHLTIFALLFVSVMIDARPSPYITSSTPHPPGIKSSDAAPRSHHNAHAHKHRHFRNRRAFDRFDYGGIFEFGQDRREVSPWMLERKWI